MSYMDIINHAREVRARLMKPQNTISEKKPDSVIERDAHKIPMPHSREFKYSATPIGDIKIAVCNHYDISHIDIISNRRDAKSVLPRQVAIYLARKMTIKSLPEIGRNFGGRDHTTILWSIRKVERMIEQCTSFATDVAKIEEAIKSKHKELNSGI